MTVGNLVALRQTRMVRLLAWSSVAQAGYILAPLACRRGGGPAARDAGRRGTATVAYTVFFVVLELARSPRWWRCAPAGADGGDDRRLRGAGPPLAVGRGGARCWRSPGWPACRRGWPGCSPRSRSSGRCSTAARAGWPVVVGPERGDRPGLLRAGRRDAVRPRPPTVRAVRTGAVAGGRHAGGHRRAGDRARASSHSSSWTPPRCRWSRRVVRAGMPRWGGPRHARMRSARRPRSWMAAFSGAPRTRRFRRRPGDRGPLS